MASYTTIEAEARARAGKGAARATRRAGKVPAVIYGGHQAPDLIALDPRIVVREIHHAGWRSRLFEVKVNGGTTRALIRDVQLHPVTDRPEHVDFQRLAPGERIRVAVAVHFQNEGISPGLKRGGVLNVVRHTVDCLVDPDQAPSQFEADLGTLDINDNIRWSDLKGTEGIRSVITDRDFVIATVAPPTKGAEPAAEAGAAAAPAAPAAAKAPAAKAPAAKAPAAKAPAAKAPAKGGKK
ncbi:MAG TPA: 50S ribosomal protein L25/general stress protein Ctc [Acetobacteraceae bacterium]|nr:50S ribosomal protein L25/general stress protein Ctc [Acetobacteraceae bacterium]